MRAKYWIYPYGPSRGALALARTLGGKLIKRKNSKYRNRRSDVVINWGASQNVPTAANLVNHAEAVRKATSKLATFRELQGCKIPTLEFTRDQAVAQQWNEKSRVFGRDLDRGSAGRGITVYESGGQVGRHLFYTKYIRKSREFRLHVYKGRVVRVLEKLRRNGHDDNAGGNKYIRSHLNGWVFASGHFGERPYNPDIERVAIEAVRALGLDFGGVDIGWSDRVGAFVFEVNTAPGLEGETTTMYARAIKEVA
jgi:hypothetical protein